MFICVFLVATNLEEGLARPGQEICRMSNSYLGEEGGPDGLNLDLSGGDDGLELLGLMSVLVGVFWYRRVARRRTSSR